MYLRSETVVLYPYLLIADKSTAIEAAVYLPIFRKFCRSVVYFSCTEKGSVPETDPLASLPRNRRWLLYWIMGLITAAMYILTQTGGGPSFIYQGY